MINQARAAKILLLILILSITASIARYFQIEYQLDTPLIPKSTVTIISRPYLFSALVSAIGMTIALVIYFFSRYLFVIIMCGLVLIWQIYYLNWGGAY
jgi:hypothetical protein